MKRRNFIKNLGGTLLAAPVVLTSTKALASPVTASEVEGPFYPITPQNDKDLDLTKVKGKPGQAKGDKIEISGQIFDQNGNPIDDVSIDLWQANTYGKYHHPHDNSQKPIDENFQSWAIIKSGKKGQYKFKTVMPGAYALGRGNTFRTPHIHFKISKLGYESLLTQMYFPNHPLNDKDPLIQRRTMLETESMTAKKQADRKGITQYQWDIYLEKI